jgi:hypothetical protein
MGSGETTVTGCSQASQPYTGGVHGRESEPKAPRRLPKTVLLGLPGLCCRAYYDASFDACPVCGCKDREITDRLTVGVRRPGALVREEPQRVTRQIVAIAGFPSGACGQFCGGENTSAQQTDLSNRAHK